MDICVSTLVVEWIEMIEKELSLGAHNVSTLVVEWIEMIPAYPHQSKCGSLHPRGGVD